VIHWETIIKLPAGSAVLGWGKRDPHQIVRFRPNVWGVQFHPEFGPGVMTYYARNSVEELKALDLDAREVAARTQAWSGDRTGVIKRFGEYVSGL
jgi:GMP synthase (glutamine-hydrolysing)